MPLVYLLYPHAMCVELLSALLGIPSGDYGGLINLFGCNFGVLSKNNNAVTLVVL
jgi:hypothetical protein